MKRPSNTRLLSRRAMNGYLGRSALVGSLIPASALAGLITPTQTEGPFYPADSNAENDVDLTQLAGHAQAAEGETILVRGNVLGEGGEPLAGAVVDIWQANHHGRYSHPRDPNTAALDPNFQGWGIMKASDEGGYGFKTIKPGAYPLSFLGGRGWRCRHIHFKVSCPGYKGLATQMYFQGDPLIAQDQEIAKVPESSRSLLIAAPAQDEASGLTLYRFNISLASEA